MYRITETSYDEVCQYGTKKYIQTCQNLSHEKAMSYVNKFDH